MTSEKFVPTTCQFSVFTPAVLFLKNKITEAIIQNHGSILNGDTIIVPLPSNAPKEIPQIIMQSSDGKFKLEIGESRVNVYRNQQETEVIDINSFLSFCSELLKTYREISKAVIGRMALVLVKYYVTKNPANDLMQHFCKEELLTGPLANPSNFEIHFHQNDVSSHDFNVNSWIRFKTGNLKNGDTPIVSVTQDTNTVAEETEEKNFSVADIDNFIKFAYNNQKKNLSECFEVSNGNKS